MPTHDDIRHSFPSGAWEKGKKENKGKLKVWCLPATFKLTKHHKHRWNRTWQHRKPELSTNSCRMSQQTTQPFVLYGWNLLNGKSDNAAVILVRNVLLSLQCFRYNCMRHHAPTVATLQKMEQHAGQFWAAYRQSGLNELDGYSFLLKILKPIFSNWNVYYFNSFWQVFGLWDSESTWHVALHRLHSVVGVFRVIQVDLTDWNLHVWHANIRSRCEIPEEMHKRLKAAYRNTNR